MNENVYCRHWVHIHANYDEIYVTASCLTYNCLIDERLIGELNFKSLAHMAVTIPFPQASTLVMNLYIKLRNTSAHDGTRLKAHAALVLSYFDRPITRLKRLWYRKRG